MVEDMVDREKLRELVKNIIKDVKAVTVNDAIIHMFKCPFCEKVFNGFTVKQVAFYAGVHILHKHEQRLKEIG